MNINMYKPTVTGTNQLVTGTNQLVISSLLTKW